MKLLIRSTLVLFFLLAIAAPAFGQNPNVAIRIGAPSLTKPGCFPVTITNLRTTVVTTSGAFLVIFDQNTCQRVCEMNLPLSKGLSPCKPLTFAICCSKKPLPTNYIAYVKVTHSAGMNEQWFFKP